MMPAYNKIDQHVFKQFSNKNRNKYKEIKKKEIKDKERKNVSNEIKYFMQTSGKCLMPTKNLKTHMEEHGMWRSS